MEFTVVQGDISNERADALVNAAGTSLRMGSGAAGFPFEDGARLVCREVWAYEPETLSDVRVIAYGDDELAVLEGAASAIQSG